MEAIAQKSKYEQLRDKPMPSKNHAIIQTNLIILLAQKYGQSYKAVSELSLKIDPKGKVPDLSIYKTLEFTPGMDEVKVAEMPLGVIEIISPTQSLSAMITKSQKYFEAGIKSYWLVLPDVLTIYIFKAPGDFEIFSKKEKLHDAQLNIELELSEVFK